MIPVRTCVACGRTGKRGFTIIGGFYLDRLGEWWKARYLPAMFVCQARRACLNRISPGLGHPAAFLNTWEPLNSQPSIHDGPIVLGQEATARLDEIIASPSGDLPEPPLELPGG